MIRPGHWKAPGTFSETTCTVLRTLSCKRKPVCTTQFCMVQATVCVAPRRTATCKPFTKSGSKRQQLHSLHRQQQIAKLLGRTNKKSGPRATAGQKRKANSHTFREGHGNFPPLPGQGAKDPSTHAPCSMLLRAIYLDAVYLAPYSMLSIPYLASVSATAAGLCFLFCPTLSGKFDAQHYPEKWAPGILCFAVAGCSGCLWFQRENLSNQMEHFAN